MSKRIFIYPVYDENGFAYCTYNFCGIEYIRFPSMLPTLYVFCNNNFEEYFREIIRACYKNKLLSIDTQIDTKFIYRYNGVAYYTSSNAGALSFLSEVHNDDIDISNTLFAFVVENMEKLNILSQQLECIRVATPIFSVLMPDSLEMMFFLAKLFEIETHGSMDTTSSIIDVVPKFSKITPNTVMDMFNPTDMFSCFSESSQVSRFTCYPDATAINTFFTLLPRVFINVLLMNPSAGFSEENCIIAINISIYVESTYHIVLACMPGLTKDLCDENMLVIKFDTEKDLLYKFIQTYATGDLIKNISPETGEMHWLFDGSVSDIYNILDRIFYLDMGANVMPFCRCVNKNIMINKNALLFNMEITNYCTYRQNNRVWLHYIDSLHEKPAPIEMTLNTEYISVKNISDAVYRSSHVAMYRDAVGAEMRLETPISVIKRYSKRAKSFLQVLNFENLFRQSVAFKISVANMYSLNKLQKSKNLLFLHYIKSGGKILMPTNNLSPSRSFLECGSLVKTYTDKNGGHSFSRPGIYNEPVVYIDFKSFYPSIYSAFSLSFQNVVIATGADIVKLLRRHKEMQDYICLYGVVFQFDDSFNRCHIEEVANDTFYLIVFRLDSDCGVANICREMINKRREGLIDAKLIMNTLCGCIGSEFFEYNNTDLYNANTYLGRRIISFTASIIDRLGQHNVDAVADLFFAYNVPVGAHSDRVINIDTDGMCVRVVNESMAKELVKNINHVFKKVEDIFYKIIKSVYVEPSIECSISFFTNYIISCEKKRYFYIDNEGRVAGTNVTTEINNLVLAIYNNQRIDKKGHGAIYNAYYIKNRVRPVSMSAAAIRTFVEVNNYFSYDAAVNLMGHLTDYNCIHTKDTSNVPAHLKYIVELYLK